MFLYVFVRREKEITLFYSGLLQQGTDLTNN